MGELRALGLFVLAVVGLCAEPAAASDADEVAAVVRQFGEAVNKGDFMTAAQAQVADPDIVDEVPPYHWHGPGAPRAWLEGWKAYAEANGVTGQHMAFAGDLRVEVSGEQAYAVLPGIFSFNIKGAPVSETGALGAFVVKTTDGWRIKAWTWAGGKPR